MFEIVELVVAGIVLGVTYGLLAMPISILFVATGKVDLAVGAYAVLAAAIASVVSGPAGAVFAILAACIAASVVGLISTVLDRNPRQDHMAAVLASFGFAVFLESFVLAIFGKDPFFRPLFTNFFSFVGLRLSPQTPVNFAVSAVAVGLLFLGLYRTSWGRDMRASASNQRGALLAGIPVQLMQISAFLIVGLLSGTAGLLIFFSTGVDFSAGLHLTLVGFGAAILFGLTSPLRGFFGGIAIGVLEAVANGYSSGFSAAAGPIIVIFLALCFGRASLEQVRGGRA